MSRNYFLLGSRSDNWGEIQDKARNAVVQIFSQVGSFDWREPYKIEEQFENRGSGFFISDQGYIVTNAHVVHEAKTVWVSISALGQKNIQATIVGFCPGRDLALLKITDEGIALLKQQLPEMPYLPLGNSDEVLRTDKVLLLGYPLGHFRIKGATGIVSGRAVEGGHFYIQITAPINPGDSGGPLLNYKGEVIGIAVATVVDVQNVGYAIPVNELRIVLQDLLKTPFLKIPFLGVRFNNGSDDLAAYLGNPQPAGFFINSVFQYSLFERAGVLAGDMLYEFNGHRLDAFGDALPSWSNEKVSIYALVSRVALYETVNLVVYRKGERKEIQFVFTPETDVPIRHMFPDYEEVVYEIVAGLVVMQLSDNHIEELVSEAPHLTHYFYMENKVNPALIISHILPGSVAHQLRVMAFGDLLVECNGVPVATLQEFCAALEHSVTTGYVTIKNHTGAFIVMPLKELLVQEQKMAEDFAYSITPVVAQLMNKVGV